MRSAALFQSITWLSLSIVITASLAVASSACRRALASLRWRSASVRREISARSCAVVSNCQVMSLATWSTLARPSWPGTTRACSRTRAWRRCCSPATGSSTLYSSAYGFRGSPARAARRRRTSSSATRSSRASGPETRSAGRRPQKRSKAALVHTTLRLPRSHSHSISSTACPTARRGSSGKGAAAGGWLMPDSIPSGFGVPSAAR
jgi:hypothetical protein